MSDPVTSRHVAALDGLRGMAIAGVLLFHDGHLLGGYLGVDLFFVLSGFLITSLLLAESGRTGTVGLGGFWARRARRLLPALAGLMVGVALYCVVFAQPAELAQIRGDGIATIFYFANWRAVFSHQDYWALFNAPSPLQHTWSLAIEEQFYLVWPLVFLGVVALWKQAARKALLVVCLAGVAISTLLMVVLYDPANISRVYYGTDTRASGIFLGGALAVALVIWGPVRGRFARLALEGAGLAGVAVLVVAWTQLDGQSERLYRGGFLAVGIAAVAVIAAATHPEAGVVSRALSWRPLCLLGLISYGVYLWHWPVYVVLDPVRTGLSGWPLLGVRLLVTLAIAIGSYVLLEQPIRHGALPAHAWRWIAPAAAVASVVVVLVATLGAAPAVSAADVKPDSVNAAVARAATAPPGAQRVMIVGNSVGFFIGKALQQVDRRPPVVTFDDAENACVFPSGATLVRYSGSDTGTTTGLFNCDDSWRNDVARFRPNVVFLIAQCCASEYQYGGKWMNACDLDYAVMYERKLRDAIDTLGSTGARVVVTTTPYTELDVLSPANRRTIDCTNRLRRELAPRFGASVVDLFGWTCPSPPGCRSSVDGVTLRSDGVHFRGEAARIVGRWLLDQAQKEPNQEGER